MIIEIINNSKAIVTREVINDKVIFTITDAVIVPPVDCSGTLKAKVVEPEIPDVPISVDNVLVYGKRVFVYTTLPQTELQIGLDDNYKTALTGSNPKMFWADFPAGTYNSVYVRHKSDSKSYQCWGQITLI